MKLEQVIFDLDGTLMQTLDSLMFTGNQMLREFNYEPVDKASYQLFVGYGARELVRRLLVASGDSEAKQLEQAFQVYMRIFENGCIYNVKPYPGIVDLIDYLLKHQIKVSVFTNKPHQLTEKVLSQGFPLNTFSVIQGQDPALPKKPDPTVALKIAGSLGSRDMRKVAFVGDSDVDMQTAVNAGMIAVGASWGFRMPEELLANGCEWLLNHPADLIGHIEEE